MFTVIQVFAALLALTPIATGRVVPYDKGVFKNVAANRGMELKGWVDGYAATRYCYRVDTTADPSLRRRPYYVTASINHNPIRTFQVVDCQAQKDRPYLAKRNIILEIDHKSGVKDGVGPPNNHVDIFKVVRP